MPFLRFAVATELTDNQTYDLGGALTTIIANELAQNHALTSVWIERVVYRFRFIGAERQRIAAHLDVNVTAGTNTENQKKAFLAKAMELLRSFFRDRHDATYIVVHEVPATDWGFDWGTQGDREASAQG